MPAAQNGLEQAFDHKGLLDDAIASYQKALRINPGYAEAQFNLGNALLKKGFPMRLSPPTGRRSGSILRMMMPTVTWGLS